jgi:hypothetical protein
VYSGASPDLHEQPRQPGARAGTGSIREAGQDGSTAAERPLRVYHDWGFYGHASTREAADLRETNRRFFAYLRTKGFEPVGGEAQDASAGRAGAIARIGCSRRSFRPRSGEESARIGILQ